MTEHCLSNHDLKLRSVGCHAGLQSFGDGPTARASCLWKNWLHLLQLSGPSLELFDDAYLLASVDLPLQLTSYKEFHRYEVWTFQLEGLRLDEGLAGLPGNESVPHNLIFCFVKIYVHNDSTL